MRAELSVELQALTISKVSLASATATHLFSQFIQIDMMRQSHELNSVIQCLDLTLGHASDRFLLLLSQPEHNEEKEETARDVAAHGQTQEVLALQAQESISRSTHNLLPSVTYTDGVPSDDLEAPLLRQIDSRCETPSKDNQSTCRVAAL